MPIVNPNKCVGCLACIKNCPVGAISLKDGKAFIDQSLCIKCGACVQICPVQAIQKDDAFAPIRVPSGRTQKRKKQNTPEIIDKISEEKINSTLEEYKEYAEKKGYSLNTDKEIVKRVIKGLLKNEKKYGLRYCPCRFVSGNKEADKKNICPCEFHEEEIKIHGACYCKLITRSVQ